MKNSPSLTTSNIISKVYNCIKPPTKLPKCSVCSNQQIQRQLEVIEGKNYVFIPDRYVEIYLCNFCQKLDQPKCKHCFNRNPCCTYKERVEFNDLFSSLKKEIIKTVTSISQTYKTYEDRSMKDLTFPQTSFISPSSINKELMVYLADVQYKLKKEIQQKIQRNQKDLFQVYKQFQTQVICRLYPFSQEGKQRYKQDLGPKAEKNMTLNDCVKFLKEVQKHKQNLEETGQQICEKYIQRLNAQYPKALYYRLNQAFRQFLLPKITYKDALIQAGETRNNVGSSHSINSSNKSHYDEDDNAGVRIEQKVEVLQKVIDKHVQTIRKMEQRIKELQCIVNIEQVKNQELQLKIDNLQSLNEMDKQDYIDQENEIQNVRESQQEFESLRANKEKQRLNMSKSEEKIERREEKQEVKTEEMVLIKTQKSKCQVISAGELQNEVKNIELVPSKKSQNDKVEVCELQSAQQQKQTRPRKPSEGRKKQRKQSQNNSWLQEVVKEVGN